MTEQAEQPESGSDVLTRMSAILGEQSAQEDSPEDEEAPETPAAEATDDDSATEGDDQADADQQTAPSDGLVEIETDDGEKYRVPAKLKDAFMREQTFTQKTQELAELKKQTLVALEHQQAMAQFQQAVAPEQAEIAEKRSTLAKYKGLDWQSMDVETYIRAQHQMNVLKEEIAEREQSVGRKAQAFQHWRAQKVQEASEAGAAYLKKAIPSWNADAQADARRQAAEIGYSEAELSEVYDPRFVRALWKAAQYDKLQASKPAAVKQAQKAPPVIKPGVSNPNVSAASKDKALRAKHKTSGDVRTAAALLMRMR